MGWYDTTVVVDGAVDETFDHAPDAYFLSKLERNAKAKNLHIEVYILFHDHQRLMDDCVCAMFEQDHHPEYSYGPEEEMGDDPFPA